MNAAQLLQGGTDRYKLGGMTTEMTDQEVKAQVVANLATKNAEIPLIMIEELVDEEFAALAGRPVRDYLSVLTERAARKRLKNLVNA